MTAALLAHQGGWDEMLMVAAPILLIAWLLRLANRRATRLVNEATGVGAGVDQSAAGSADTSAPTD